MLARLLPNAADQRLRSKLDNLETDQAETL